MRLRHYSTLCAFFSLAIAGCSTNSGESGSPIQPFTPPQGQALSKAPVLSLAAGETWDGASQRLTTASTLFTLTCERGFDLNITPIQLTSAPYQESGDQLLSYRTATGTVSGGGDSGTPIVSKKQVGAETQYQMEGVVFAGYDSAGGYGRYMGQLQTMLSLGRATPPTRAGNTPRNLVSWVLSSNNPEAANRLMQSPKMEASRKIWQNRQGATRKAEDLTRASDSAAYTPAAGHRYAFMYAYGPEISLYGYATLSFETSPGKFLATGHPIDGTGPRQFPIFAAYTDGRLQDGSVLAHPVGSKPWGALIYDGQFGSVIEKRANVPTVPVRVTLKVDGATLADKVQHNIALDKDIFVEDLALAYSFFIPLYNRLDYRGKKYLGTARVSLKWDDGSVFNETFEVGHEEYDDDFNIIYTPGTADDIVNVIYFAYPVKGKAITSATLTVDVASSD